MSLRYRINRFASEVCPPALLPHLKSFARFASNGMRSVQKLVSGRGTFLRGRFQDWDAACQQATGYDQPIILDRMIAAADEALKSKGQKFDRDTVVFDRPITPFPLLAFVLMTASKRPDRFHVLDFGGGLGSTYRQCQPFLSQLPYLRWSVVEQPHIVAAGRSRYQSEVLQFHDSLEDAAKISVPNIVILSGVLQYLEDAHGVLGRVKRLKPEVILIDRTPFCEKVDDQYSLQITDDQIFPARLPYRIFGKESLENTLSPSYRGISEFDTVDPDMLIGAMQVKMLGRVFRTIDT
jgi:putative methyltransferase (TIGR04325 family)